MNEDGLVFKTHEDIELARRIFANDFMMFCAYFFRVMTGEVMKINWHHKLLCKLVEEVVHKRVSNVLVNISPGSSKSALVSRLFPLYCYALNPHSRFLLTSYSDSLVEGHSVAIKDVLGSPEFQALYPNLSFKADSNKKSEWILQKSGVNIGEFCAFPIGGGLTGRRAGYMDSDVFNGCIIIDDPIKPADALSKAFREDCNNKLTNTIYSRRALSTTPIFLIMQRLHTDDPTGALLANSKLKWTHVNIPAIMTPADVEKLPAFIRDEAYKYMGASFEKYGEASYWEYKEPLESLHALKEEDPDTFMSQYMQEPSPEGGVLIQKSWFPQYKDLPSDLTNFRITADTAVSAKQTADNSVFLLTAENKMHDLFVLDLVKGKWEMPQLIQNALNFVAKFKTNYPNALFKGFYIEYKQSGQGLLQTLRQNTRLPLIDVTPKGDKVLRVQQCLPYMQSHRIHVPESSSWVTEFMDELARFTPTMKHKHDDQVDALVYAIFDAYIDCRIARVSNYQYL